MGFFMKKFIALFLSVMVLFSLAACGNGSASSDGFTQGSEWIEVQSIEYFLNDSQYPHSNILFEKHTITSSFYVDFSDEKEEVTKEEYDNAQLYYYDLITDQEIHPDKSNLQTYLQYKDKYAYHKYHDYDNDKIIFFKYKLTTIITDYVNIRFLSDGSLEIKTVSSLPEETSNITRIKPLSYSIE